MKKALSKAKLLIAKHIRITKETKSKVYFEVKGFKGSYNKDMKQAPEWFTNWSTNFEKKNDSRWDKQEKFNKTIIKRLDNLVKKNDLEE